MSPRKRRGKPGPRSSPTDFGAVYPLLDLHGETADSARRLAERWLRDRQAEGATTVRIITGRGLRSRGPPVLRGEIEDLLSALRGTVVSEFSSESLGGAFRVELLWKPAEPSRGRGIRATPAPRGPAALDPELRRRAEEALWELGIDPTPQLLEAEMRRLREEERGEGT